MKIRIVRLSYGVVVAAAWVLFSSDGYAGLFVPLDCSTSTVTEGGLPGGNLGGADGPTCVPSPNSAGSSISRGFSGGLDAFTALSSANMVVGVGAFSGSTHVGISGATLNADTFAAMATGTIQDFITIPPIPLVGGSGGTLHIPLHLTGALSVNSEVSAGAPPPTLFAQFSFEWTVDGLPVGHDGISLSAAGMLNAMPVDRTFVITVPFNFGVEVAFGSRYIIAANFVLSSAQACPMQSCDFAIAQGVIDSDFAHTGTFERATVLDNDGNPVPGATIISASGFDYLNPAGPGPAAVPEPSTLALICSAGIAVGVWRVVRWSGAANKWRQASNCET